MSFVLAVLRERFDSRPLVRGLLAYGEGEAQRRWRRTESYDFSYRNAKPSRTPLFGTSKGFGTDYIVTKSIPVAPVGYRRNAGVPRPVVNNVQGRVKNWRPNPDIPKMPSHARRFPEGGTDQKPPKRGGSPVSRWDGVVRNFGGPKGFESSRRPREPTTGDRLTAEMKKEIYTFF